MRIILIYDINGGAFMNNLNSIPESTTQLQEFATPNQNMPIPSKLLFAHGNVVQIQHQNDQYYLRRTRNGKLILTK